MAQDIKIGGATYSAVPSVELNTPTGSTVRFTDISDSTIDASKVAEGYIAYDADGTRLTGTMTGGGGGGEYIVKHGTFTPTNSDYVSKGHIDVPYEGEIVSVVVVDTVFDNSTIDRYSVYCLSIHPTYKAGANVCQISARYKSSASSGSSWSNASSNGPYAMLSTYMDSDASGYYYLVNLYNNIARFKTYGSYRWRVGRTYEYWIITKK